MPFTCWTLAPGWLDSKEQLRVDWEEGRWWKHLKGSRSLHDKYQRLKAMCLGLLSFQSISEEEPSRKQTKLGGTVSSDVHQQVQSSPAFTATVSVLLLDFSYRAPLPTLKMCLLMFIPHLKYALLTSQVWSRLDWQENIARGEYMGGIWLFFIIVDNSGDLNIFEHISEQ